MVTWKKSTYLPVAHWSLRPAVEFTFQLVCDGNPIGRLPTRRLIFQEGRTGFFLSWILNFGHNRYEMLFNPCQDIGKFSSDLGDFSSKWISSHIILREVSSYKALYTNPKSFPAIETELKDLIGSFLLFYKMDSLAADQQCPNGAHQDSNRSRATNNSTPNYLLDSRVR